MVKKTNKKKKKTNTKKKKIDIEKAKKTVKFTVLESEIKEIKPEKKESLEESLEDEEGKIDIIEGPKEEYKKLSLDYNAVAFKGSEDVEQIGNLDDLKNIAVGDKQSFDEDVINNLYSVNPKGSDNLYNSKTKGKAKDANPDSFIVQYKESASINNDLLYNGSSVDDESDMNSIYQTTQLRDTFYSGAKTN